MPQPCPVCYEPTTSTTLCRACSRSCPRETTEFEFVRWAVERARRADRKRERIALEQRCLAELQRLCKRKPEVEVGYLLGMVAWPSTRAARRTLERLIAAGAVERRANGTVAPGSCAT